jgi:FkbM family methyltransferase
MVRALRRPFQSADPSIHGGEWLYERHLLQWLCKQPSRTSLPPLHRLFARWCNFQFSLGRERIFGGASVLKSVIWLGKVLRLKDHAELQVGAHKVFLDLHDPRMLHVPNELSADFADTSILNRFLNEGDTFIDAGANHGSFSIIASKAVGSRGLVIAIEPQSRKAELIEKSLATNGYSRYEVHQFACGDQNGVIDFYIPEGSSGAAGIFPEFSAVTSHQKVAVPMRRFDNAVNWNTFPGRVFLKLDVEGSETRFLRGAREMIQARRPHIMLEINPIARDAAGEPDDSLQRYLEELDYDQFFEVNPFSGPKPLYELDTTDGDLRNIIVTARNRLLRAFPLALFEPETALSLLWVLT